MSTVDPGTRLTTVSAIVVDGADLRLQRLWPRRAAHALVEYAEEHSTPARLVGQWFADPLDARDSATATCAAAGPRAACLSDDGHVVIHRRSADRRLRPLRGILEDPAARLVVHRPERRAVVRLAGTPHPVWVKVVRPERLDALLAAARSLDTLGERTPRLLAAQPDGTTRWAHLPGAPFSERIGDACNAVADASAVAELLHRLHAAPSCAPDHGAEDEARVLTGWLEHLAFWDPATHARVAPRVPAVLDELVTGTGRRRRTTVHRDVHDGQVLVDGGDARILDPDTVATGEPELDLGNFAAHVHLAARQGRCTPATAHAVVAELVDGYGAGIDARRLRAYTSAALLRLVAVHALRPATRAGVDALVADVEGCSGRTVGSWGSPR